MTEQKHTPVPWQVAREKGSPKRTVGYWDNDKFIPIAKILPNFNGKHHAKSNAEFIVCACNNHDDLVAVLDFIAGHARMAKGLHAPSMQQSLENIEQRAMAALAKGKQS